MNVSHLAQAIYQDKTYGSSYYSADDPLADSSGSPLADIGSPLLYALIFGISIVLAAIFIVLKSAFAKRRNLENQTQH